jgi:membrane protein implicated in regulation of membrane protease activity
MSWVVWILIACAFGIGETVLTTGFFLAPFAIGAALAAAADAAVGAPRASRYSWSPQS